ncbi:MAG: c-type cytochrome [Pirellulaceae bacterium]|nr:c-type cytochrome [Pirellulaceae bacterium]
MAALIVEAVLTQQDSRELLVAELRGTRIPSPIARLVLDRVRLSGQEMPELASAIRRSGELKELVGITPDEASQLIGDVARLGDPCRGQEIYQRKNLNCTGCHAIAGSPAGIGPDLSSIGASARVADLLQSILDP